MPVQVDYMLKKQCIHPDGGIPRVIDHDLYRILKILPLLWALSMIDPDSPVLYIV